MPRAVRTDIVQPDGRHVHLYGDFAPAPADYKAPAMLGDEIVLRTWVGTATRLTFERFTEIRRKSDGQLLSQACTLWCPTNAQTGRPMRVSTELRTQFST